MADCTGTTVKAKPVQLTVAEAIAALKVARNAFDPAQAASAAARAAAQAIWKAPKTDMDAYSNYPLPPELSPPVVEGVTKTTMDFSSGESMMVDHRQRLDSEEAILTHCAGDTARAAPLVRALKAWKKARSAIAREPSPPPEAAEAYAAKGAAQRVRAARCNELEAAGRQLLKAKPATPAEVHAKIKAYVDLAIDPDDERALRILMKDLGAVTKAPSGPAAPTPTPGGLLALWEERQKIVDIADDDDDSPEWRRLDRVTDAIIASPIVTGDDAAGKLELLLHLSDTRGMVGDHVLAMAPQIIAFLRGHSPHGGAPATQPTAWAAAYAVYEQARAAERAIDAEAGAARELVEAEAPCPPELELPDDRRYVVESSIIDDKKLSFDEKAALVAIHREWQIRRDAAIERHGLDALIQASREANEAAVDAQDALWEVSPSSITELAIMFQMFMEERFLDCQPEAFVSRLAEELTGDADYDRSLVARLYQNVVRLTGADDPVLEIAPFDAKAWIIAFERHPGHHVWSGHATYTEPHAFGPNGLCLADFRVEGEALERYADEHWKQLQPEYYAEWLSRGKGPIQAFGREQVAEIWAYDPEEQERRVAMWDRYKSQQPTGKHLADRLETWQKKLVAKEGRERDLEVEALAPGHQSASDFVRAYEECGGTIHLHDDSIWLGAPVGEGADEALYMLAPLRRRLEDNASYKAEVISYLRHRPPAAIDTGDADLQDELEAAELIEPRAEAGMGGQ